MKIDNQIPIERLISIWRQTDSMDKFLSQLPKIEVVDPYILSALVLLTPADSSTLFNKIMGRFSGSKIEEQRSDSVLWYLRTYVGREKEEKIEGRGILFLDSPGISFLFTVSTSEFLYKCLLRFLMHSYPRIIQPILKQDDLMKILVRTKDRLLPNTIRSIKTSAKRWVISQEPSGERKRMGSRLDWENMSIEEAFRESAEEGKWFIKLTFRVYIQKEKYLRDTGWKSTITKRGMFLTNRWLKQYSEVVIPYLHSIAEEKMNLYKNRSRAETKAHEINPLAVNFEDAIFEDKENNERLIATLKKIPHFGYSVIHANPYIHMSLLDYKDGSAFEILVHRPDRIVILPQIRTSSISLERVIGHIVEEFSEGRVEDLKES